MSRIEENKEVVKHMIETANAKSTGTFEDMTVFQLGVIATMLTDISKSLAVIASSVEGTSSCTFFTTREDKVDE